MQVANDGRGLEQLENAQWTRRIGLLPVCLLVSSVFLLLILILLGIDELLRSQHSVDDIGPLTVCLALFVSSLWGLMSSNCDYRWWSSSKGLHVRGIARRRLVRWTDIARANVAWRANWPAPCYILRTGRSKVVVPLHDAQFRASIQHYLRLHGKADAFALAREDSTSVLEAALDDVAWENQRRGDFGRARVAFVVLMLAWLGIEALLLLTRHYIPAVALGMVWYARFRAGKLSPAVMWRIESTSSAVTAVAAVDFRVARIVLPWQGIRHVEWLGDRLYIRSYGRGIVTVVIPWHRDDPASTRLLLSMLSHLHGESECQWVPIPVALSGDARTVSSDRQVRE